jgi:hypothetical protein
MRITESELRRIIRQEARRLSEARAMGEVWVVHTLSEDGWPQHYGLAAGDSRTDAVTNAGGDPSDSAEGAELYNPKRHSLIMKSMQLTDADVKKVASGKVNFISKKKVKYYDGPRDMYGNYFMADKPKR